MKRSRLIVAALCLALLVGGAVALNGGPGVGEAERWCQGNGYAYQAQAKSIHWRDKTYVFSHPTRDKRKYTEAQAALRAIHAPAAITDIREVASGLLVATDAGEFGGALWLVRPDQDPLMVIGKNTVGLFDLGGSTVALTGLAHLSLDYGEVYRLDLAGLVPSATSFAKLPGAPLAWTMAGESALLVATESRGVAVLPDGSIHEASVKRECSGQVNQ